MVSDRVAMIKVRAATEVETKEWKARVRRAARHADRRYGWSDARAVVWRIKKRRQIAPSALFWTHLFD